MPDLDAARLLAGASTVAELIPVDDAAAAAVGRRLRGLAATLDAADRELRALDAIPSWRGDAGRSFERSASRLPDDTRHGARVFDASGRSFTELAIAISSARPDVIAAFNLWQVARHQSVRWQGEVGDAFRMGEAPPGLASTDPGHDTAGRAIVMYARARERIEDATERAVKALALAGESAPGIDALIQREGPLETLGSVGRGVGDFARDAGQFAWDFNQLRAVRDWDGYSADVENLMVGAGHLMRNPDDIDDVVLNLQLLRDDPARWFGNMIIPFLFFPPIPGASSLSAGTTGRVATKLGRPGAFVAHTIDDLTSLAAQFRLPMPHTLDALSSRASTRQILDSARRVEAKTEDLDRIAEEHGGDVGDYERKVATIGFEGEPDLTFEFVHNSETDEIHEPHIVAGGFPAGCPD